MFELFFESSDLEYASQDLFENFDCRMPYWWFKTVRTHRCGEHYMPFFDVG